MELNTKFYFRGCFTFIFFIAFADIIVGVNVGTEDEINFEVNGFYLDDMLTYSPARLGSYFNSSRDNFTVFAAEAHRPQALECPSLNVISTRYRCKVWEIPTSLK